MGNRLVAHLVARLDDWTDHAMADSWADSTAVHWDYLRAELKALRSADSKVAPTVDSMDYYMAAMSEPSPVHL